MGHMTKDALVLLIEAAEGRHADMAVRLLSAPLGEFEYVEVTPQQIEQIKALVDSKRPDGSADEWELVDAPAW